MKKALIGLGLVLALAGCGGEKAPEVASAADSSGAPGATATSDAVATYVETRRQWAKCLREQGFDIPDPDAQGRIEIASTAEENRRLKADPKWTAAQEACEQFLMEVPAELQPKREPLTAEQIANSRRYSECRRANGSPDFPDPGPDGLLPENWGSGELTPPEQAADTRSAQICEPVRRGDPPASPDPNQTAGG
ncbi:membrane lipoprotein lipid attachment site-containing protein [Micromonospora sp. CPCC 205371]|nr:membrane lipoprotein lipid attachment site-containing protein [Micromonospora sp. CPCC 205371]